MLCHSLSKVLLPNPLGAQITVTGLSSRLVRRGRVTSLCGNLGGETLVKDEKEPYASMGDANVADMSAESELVSIRASVACPARRALASSRRSWVTCSDLPRYALWSLPPRRR